MDCGQARPWSRPAWAACLHSSVRQAWAGAGRTMGPLSRCRPPTEEPPWLLPRPLPAGAGSRRCAGREQLPPASRPQAHLLPRRPLSRLPTPDLLGALSPSLAQRKSCSLPGQDAFGQVDSPTVLCVRLRIQDGLRGGISGTLCPVPGGCSVVHPGGPFLVHLGMLPNRTSDGGGAHTEDALGSLARISPRPWGGQPRLAHLGGLPTPWSWAWTGWAGCHPPPRFDDQASSVQLPLSASSSVAGKEEEPVLQQGAVASSCPTMEGIERWGRCYLPGLPSPPGLWVPSATQDGTRRPVTGSTLSGGHTTFPGLQGMACRSPRCQGGRRTVGASWGLCPQRGASHTRPPPLP